MHRSAVKRSGLSTLQEGQKVSFEVETARHGKTSAETLEGAGVREQCFATTPRLIEVADLIEGQCLQTV